MVLNGGVIDELEQM